MLKKLGLDLRCAAWAVAGFDFLVGPIGFLIINRMSLNPHLNEVEYKLDQIHPEAEAGLGVNRTSVIMAALQGLVLNEWAASMIFYPPVLLTFLVGLEFLIAIHQRNYCVGKLALILNYVLLAFLLILSIVLLANSSVGAGGTVSPFPFLIFSVIQCVCIWIVFKYTMYELRNPGVVSGCYTDRTGIMPTRLHSGGADGEEDLNL